MKPKINTNKHGVTNDGCSEASLFSFRLDTRRAYPEKASELLSFEYQKT